MDTTPDTVPDLDQLVNAVRAHSGLSLEEIVEAYEHGADAGWAGFTWTSDCVDFVTTNRELVWGLLTDEADEFGSPNVAAHVAGLRCADMADTPEGLDSLLAWWALEAAGRYLSDTAEERHEDELGRMRELGEEYGRKAASWLLDGYLTREATETLLRGILEGDPEVLEQLPSVPLSGEWADGLTPAQVLREADIEVREDLTPEAESELLDAFEDGYAVGSSDGAEAEARARLGIPDGATAEVLTCCGCGRTFVAAAGVNFCGGCAK